jgi:hypothetical protein
MVGIHRACTHALRHNHIWKAVIFDTILKQKPSCMTVFRYNYASFMLSFILHFLIYFLRIFRKHRHLVSSMHALLSWLRLLTCFGKTKTPAANLQPFELAVESVARLSAYISVSRLISILCARTKIFVQIIFKITEHMHFSSL